MPRLSATFFAIALCAVSVPLGCSSSESKNTRSTTTVNGTPVADGGADVGPPETFGPPETCGGAAPYAVAGPYAAGVKTVTVDGLLIEVFYPADRKAVEGRPRAVYDVRDWLAPADRAKVPDSDAPTFTMDAVRDATISTGRFPLVLFSHGLGGYRLQSSFLLTHLASWGMVVAAPEHQERGLAAVLAGDLSKIEDRAIEQLRAARTAVAGGELASSIDAQRTLVMAHSQGGAAASEVVYDEGVVGWALLASPGFGEGPKRKPLLMMGGTADTFATPTAMTTSFEKQPRTKHYIQIRDGVHLGFTDICRIAPERGGPLAVARANGIEVPELALSLVSDGCKTTSLPVEQSWPLVRHYATAHARAALGDDTTPRGLDAPAAACFGDRVAEFRTESAGAEEQ